MAGRAIDWAAIHADRAFRRCTGRNATLTLLMALSVVYYFLLPVGCRLVAGAFPAGCSVLSTPVSLLALSEFVVAVCRRVVATPCQSEFDRLAEDIRRRNHATASAGALR